MEKEIRPFGFALDVENCTSEERTLFVQLWDKIKPVELKQKEKADEKLKEDRDYYKRLWNDSRSNYKERALRLAFDHCFSGPDIPFDVAEKIYQWLIKEED